MRWSYLIATALLAAGASATHAVAANAGDPVAGRRLYFEGVSASGKPVTGKTQNDIEITGEQFSCVSCHRPSAYGSSEGGVYVPPIRGDILFSAAKGNRNRIFHELYTEGQSKEFWAQMRNPRLRPAYTEKTLAVAITQGTDPAGRVLDPTMPRYALSAADLTNLTAYLRTLKTAPDPGVGRDEINFATIITPGVSPEEEKAMLDTMSAFVKWTNTHTQGDLSSPGFSPNYRSDFLPTLRYWNLHIWRLTGAPETWRDQLDKLYEEQPVFAVVGGLIAGPYSPIADFCDATETPCVFPITDLPKTRESEYGRTLYFSRGRELEGEALAVFLTADGGEKADVEQFFLSDNEGRASAAAFEHRAAEQGARVDSHSFTSISDLEVAIADCCKKKKNAVVIWPGKSVSELAAKLPKINYRKVRTIALPSDALPLLIGADRKLKERIVFSYPYEKPGVLHPREFDVRAWFGSRRVTITNPRVQFDTYFALSMIEHSYDHLLGDFNRDYLIELIEHEAEKNLNVGIYPTLALGPGQRFASKGAYIMRFDEKSKAGFAPASEWIVP